MENLDPRLRNAPYFRCEKGDSSVPVCQECETCVLAWNIFSTKQWFRRIGEVPRRKFLVSILEQLGSLYLLHYFQNILQTTQGKDFIYSRSRINLSRKEGKIVRSSLNQMLDKTVEQKMREILSWFARSTHRTKANYTLFLLQMCDLKLLLTAANVIRVLSLRQWNNVADYNVPYETSDVFWAASTKTASFPLSRASGKENSLENRRGEASNTDGQWKSSIQCILEMNSLFSGKAGLSKAEYTPSNLLVDLDVVKDLSSGVSKYRDFIRSLPVHLSKYILSMLGCTGGFLQTPWCLTGWLGGSQVHVFFFFFSGMLDKNSLNRCASVSQHWAMLVQQVKMELSMHPFIQSHITFLQGSYTKGIDPNYANKLFIPVPKITDNGKCIRVKNQKLKLRTKNDYNLWAAYQNQETQQVLMEERNIFCGTYNIRILSDTWDRNRVIHYSGGDLVAVSSNRKIQLLDVIQVKELPTEFRGHAGSVRTLFLCEEENFLLSGSYDLSIRSWDLKSGACIRIFNGHQGTVTCMDLYKNRLVSGARDCQVKEWDIETGKCLKTFKHKDPILATKINDTYIVSSCERGLVKVWHIVSAQLVKTLSGHEGAVKCLCCDQWHLLSGSTDGLVMAWSMVGKYERCLMAYKHPKEVLHVALLFLRVISACADGKIRIYNFLNGNCLKVMKVNGRGDPVLSFFIQGNRMVINTESNILMFQFENIKWQYSMDQAKQKKKDKDEDREENDLTEVASRSSTQVFSPRDSMSSKQTVGQESLLSKSYRSRVFLKDTRAPTEDEEKVPPGDLIRRSKKKRWQIPMSPDQFLLTVNALQRAHKSGEFAYPQRPRTQVIDAWGPSISHPRKVLNFKGISVQQAVNRLRHSNPPIDVKQTSIPLEIQKLQPNLKNSLHSPQVQSTIPQPVIVYPRFAGGLKGEDQATGPVGGTVRSCSPLTSLQVIKPNRMLAPPVGTRTKSIKKDRPRFYTTLDPFRMNTEFMLLTVKEEKEYREAKMKEFQARKPRDVVSPEKASRAARIRKIKGLPINHFMKQGKTAAPELGQNVFI
ncbi:F-box and WD repeat domain containing protein 10B isoform X2 [Mustela nigripes]|uniref:F-box and WD repeat domain containing protein 10B isoform X2 n=1 Tax=Mustela nigripes TaxID=77151 RepID=UPI002814F642|nr:F-box and WD repeat domain containing protein 10B isoform X2 [Mustela nigripes]